MVKKEIFSEQWALILQAAIQATKQHDSFAEEWRIICKQEKDSLFTEYLSDSTTIAKETT